MNINDLINERLGLLKQSAFRPDRLPISVYRLQFNAKFTFKDATRLIPYLNELGVTDCYASPYLKARSGSLHGYDITDQNSLNPEVGSEEDFRDFVFQLQKHNMGQILDFVPNHMSVFDNLKWLDVLENGPASVYARFFDIDWDPPQVELHNKILLPILEGLYGIVLEKGLIGLDYDRGAFLIKYRDYRLPLAPETIAPVLETTIKNLRHNMPESNPEFIELESIVTASQNLPGRSERDSEKIKQRHREKEVIKKRLEKLEQQNGQIKSALAESITAINGSSGDRKSFLRIHEILEEQYYRLSFWRVAAEEINYRHFFDVNEMIALRTEDPVVFEEIHRLLRELFGRGLISGIRLDHVDGLFDPEKYLNNLQKDCWLESVARKLKQNSSLSEVDLPSIKNILTQKYSGYFNRESESAFHPVYIIVEKILSEGEEINQEWPVDGTTGYEFMAALNGIFVDNRQSGKLLNTYRWFTRSDSSYDDIAYQGKKLVMLTTMASEVNMLAYRLNKIGARSWEYRDFTLNSLHYAIQEVIACFPVYRTYINADSEAISRNDKACIDCAIKEAKRRNPAVNPAVFDFILSTLLLHYPEGMEDSGREEQKLFVMRFQQFTGTVMAKGAEDTAFYIYNPLVSLNEVGNNPGVPGTSIQEFHRKNILRRKAKPQSFSPSSTHDSKRGEDVRARINVLSEIPGEWRSALHRWSRWNKNLKPMRNGEPMPDRNDEYLLYQTLIGTYPIESLSEKELTEYANRIQNYMLKAIKEAKVHTSWMSPNPDYEGAMTNFVRRVLNPGKDNLFLSDFKRLNFMTATCGIYNSLSQVVLKTFSPGVPDIYQGNELWAFNLTDPDNRVTVDYARRIEMLGQLKEQAAVETGKNSLIDELLNKAHDGRIKLFVTWKSLNYRKDNRYLFEGAYLPLKTAGSFKNNLCVFSWIRGEKELIVAVPRFLSRLTQQATLKPLGKSVWGDTRIIFPRKLKKSVFKNIFTGEMVQIEDMNYAGLPVAGVFNSFPVAVLEGH
jgi:(1->4)-alpha-D-glucan 1-alpha-D-glucosylmutase